MNGADRLDGMPIGPWWGELLGMAILLVIGFALYALLLFCVRRSKHAEAISRWLGLPY